MSFNHIFSRIDLYLNTRCRIFLKSKCYRTKIKLGIGRRKVALYTLATLELLFRSLLRRKQNLRLLKEFLEHSSHIAFVTPGMQTCHNAQIFSFTNLQKKDPFNGNHYWQYQAVWPRWRISNRHSIFIPNGQNNFTIFWFACFSIFLQYKSLVAVAFCLLSIIHTDLGAPTVIRVAWAHCNVKLIWLALIQFPLNTI